MMLWRPRRGCGTDFRPGLRTNPDVVGLRTPREPTGRQQVETFDCTYVRVGTGCRVLGVGVAGFFVTGFDNFLANGDESLLIFEANPFRNVVHLGVGALALSAGLALRDRAAVQGINLGIAAVYVLATLGFAGYLQILSIDGTWAADNFLHVGTGLVALAFSGLVTRTAVKRRAERTPATAVGVGPSRAVYDQPTVTRRPTGRIGIPTVAPIARPTCSAAGDRQRTKTAHEDEKGVTMSYEFR